VEQETCLVWKECGWEESMCRVLPCAYVVAHVCPLPIHSKPPANDCGSGLWVEISALTGLYRVTPIVRKRLPHQDPPRTLGTGLLWRSLRGEVLLKNNPRRPRFIGSAPR